jgi:hypothetical protein
MSVTTVNLLLWENYVRRFPLYEILFMLTMLRQLDLLASSGRNKYYLVTEADRGYETSCVSNTHHKTDDVPCSNRRYV